MVRTTQAETVTNHTAAPDAEPADDERSGRLTKFDWTTDSEHRLGRGFDNRAGSALDSSIDVAGPGIFP